MKRDQAAKIAEWTYPIDEHSTWESDAWAVAMRGPLARRIRRAITSAVRKERERCVLCVIHAAPADYLARPYIDAINRKKTAENVRMIERYDSGVRKATAKQLDAATKAIRKGKA